MIGPDLALQLGPDRWMMPMSELPIPIFTSVKAVTSLGNGKVALICPDPMSGRPFRYTVLLMDLATGFTKVIGRELNWLFSKRVVNEQAQLMWTKVVLVADDGDFLSTSLPLRPDGTLDPEGEGPFPFTAKWDGYDYTGELQEPEEGAMFSRSTWRHQGYEYQTISDFLTAPVKNNSQCRIWEDDDPSGDRYTFRVQVGTGF